MITCPKCNKIILLHLMFGNNGHYCTVIVQCPNKECNTVYRVKLEEVAIGAPDAV